jgi:pSer/pThr/pTyr-binding forkhead associated (FHA) protein
LRSEERTLFESPVESSGGVVAVLVVLEGELAGEIFPVHEGNNSIGRSSQSDVVLGSRWVSREHANLLWNQATMQLTAISDKPTRVNTVVVTPGSRGASVADGDTIHLGRTSLRVRTVD